MAVRTAYFARSLSLTLAFTLSRDRNRSSLNNQSVVDHRHRLHHSWVRPAFRPGDTGWTTAPTSTEDGHAAAYRILPLSSTADRRRLGLDILYTLYSTHTRSHIADYAIFIDRLLSNTCNSLLVSLAIRFAFSLSHHTSQLCSTAQASRSCSRFTK